MIRNTKRKLHFLSRKIVFFFSSLVCLFFVEFLSPGCVLGFRCFSFFHHLVCLRLFSIFCEFRETNESLSPQNEEAAPKNDGKFLIQILHVECSTKNIICSIGLLGKYVVGRLECFFRSHSL